MHCPPNEEKARQLPLWERRHDFQTPHIVAIGTLRLRVSAMYNRYKMLLRRESVFNCVKILSKRAVYVLQRRSVPDSENYILVQGTLT
jgi:hypothetical protein